MVNATITAAWCFLLLLIKFEANIQYSIVELEEKPWASSVRDGNEKPEVCWVLGGRTCDEHRPERVQEGGGLRRSRQKTTLAASMPVNSMLLQKPDLLAC